MTRPSAEAVRELCERLRNDYAFAGNRIAQKAAAMLTAIAAGKDKA